MIDKLPQKNKEKISALTMRITGVFDHFDDEIKRIHNRLTAIEKKLIEIKTVHHE